MSQTQITNLQVIYEDLLSVVFSKPSTSEIIVKHKATGVTQFSKSYPSHRPPSHPYHRRRNRIPSRIL